MNICISKMHILIEIILRTDIHKEVFTARMSISTSVPLCTIFRRKTKRSTAYHSSIIFRRPVIFSAIQSQKKPSKTFSSHKLWLVYGNILVNGNYNLKSATKLPTIKLINNHSNMRNHFSLRRADVCFGGSFYVAKLYVLSYTSDIKQCLKI